MYKIYVIGIVFGRDRGPCSLVSAGTIFVWSIWRAAEWVGRPRGFIFLCAIAYTYNIFLVVVSLLLYTILESWEPGTLWVGGGGGEVG